MAKAHRDYPWNASPIGGPEQWDTALKTLVPIMLASNQPMFVVWGPARTLLYNDGYAQILGGKHPAALGRDFLDVWHEIRGDLLPLVEGAYSGQPRQMDDIELWMERNGYREETHFSFFYAPVRAESGEVEGFFCACNEITAQIVAERQLVESEARHRGILENMEEGFTLFDRDFTIVEVNGAATAMVGLTRDEMVGSNHWERFPGTEHSALGEMYRQVLADGRGRLLEHKYMYPDGREQWFEVRAFTAAEGLVALFRDVTDRKRLEIAAAEAVERVQLALDAGAIVGTWVWDVQHDRVVGDERFATSFGLDPAALADGVSIEYAFNAIHPDDQQTVQDAVAAAVERKSQYRCQYRVKRDGAYRWVEASGRVETDEDGRPTRFPGVLLDIEDRRQAEKQRDDTLALLRTFIEAVPGAVYAKDREGRYLMANRGAAGAFGCQPDDLIGRTDVELLSNAEEAGALAANDREVIDQGEPIQLEEVIQHADGRSIAWWSTKEPLRDHDGRVIGLVGTSVDISERKRMVEALREADRRKDEFLAMLAHELRNPLAPINTAAHILRMTAADSKPVQQASQVIARQVGHLTRLVDDLLDVSRVTRGLVQLERTSVDLRSVISTAIEQAQPLMQSRCHELRTKIGTGSLVVDGDFHRLVQIVSNLLNNAAKYTPQGGVIGVELSSSEGQALLSVSDNGIGIGADTIDRVFDLFAQAERTPDRTQGGLGIGLSLVRSLVQLHGGHVRAESAGLSRGSTFLVTLPLGAECEVVHPKATTSRPAAPLKILVVDDNVDAARTLADVLQLNGHVVATAEDGQSALDRAARQDWDAYILDIGLPDMTGYELASRIRDLSGAADPVLFALTGYGQAHDRVISKAAGINHHLVKPANIPQLMDLLSDVEPRR